MQKLMTNEKQGLKSYLHSRQKTASTSGSDTQSESSAELESTAEVGSSYFNIMAEDANEQPT